MSKTPIRRWSADDGVGRLVNDLKLCRAGVGSEGVLSAVSLGRSCQGRRPPRRAASESPSKKPGLMSADCETIRIVRWSERDLHVGDRVAIVLGRAAAADPPVRETRREAQQAENLERDYDLRLKRKFEGPGPQPSIRPGGLQHDQFLNVDLDIWSKTPLDPLVSAFGEQVLVLHAGKRGRSYAAHLELSMASHSADRLLRRFVTQEKQLPRAAKLVWNRAQTREFNLGIQAAARPYSFELRLEQETVRAVASVDARIGVTVYRAHSSQGPRAGPTRAHGATIQAGRRDSRPCGNQ